MAVNRNREIARSPSRAHEARGGVGMGGQPRVAGEVADDHVARPDAVQYGAEASNEVLLCGDKRFNRQSCVDAMQRQRRTHLRDRDFDEVERLRIAAVFVGP